MRRAGSLLALALILLLAGCSSQSQPTAAATHTPAPPTSRYSAILAPLNVSGVSGTVVMTITSNEMSVTISLKGLVPNQEHMQHIHGAHNMNATCPTAASANSDGIITLAAGTPAYGPVALPFEPTPTPTADADGNISWSQQLIITPDEEYDLVPLTSHVVLIHGMTYKGVYDQVLPAACGPIHAD